MQDQLLLKQKGQSLIEFAAIATALVIVVMGVFEFGRAFYYYSAIVNAAQEGARYGTTTGVNTSAKRDAIVSTAIQSAIALDTSVLTATVSCANCATAKTGDQFTVTVNYTFTAVTPVIPNFPLQGKASMMIDHSP